MIHTAFFCLFLSIGVTVSSNLQILDERLNSSEEGRNNIEIKNCSDKSSSARPNSKWGEWDVGVWMRKRGQHSVMNVTWILDSDARVFTQSGSEINILDKSTNQRICVQFSHVLTKQLNKNGERWRFSLNGVVVEPGHTYMVSVYSLPKNSKIEQSITIPGCAEPKIWESIECLQNGSSWDPDVSDYMSVDREHKMLTTVVSFQAALYSETYQVSIRSLGYHSSKIVSNANGTLLNVTFNIDLRKLSQCELSITIQPFFIRCKNECRRIEKVTDHCLYYPPRTKFVKAAVGLFVIGTFFACVLWRSHHNDPVNTFSSAVGGQPEAFQVRKNTRKKVLIIYSLDHPLYKHIILKLSAFLVARCGTEAVLDLLDSARLGVLGSIQWLDWHREQIENSSDKILILCSRGVQAKWRAMCGDKQVFLREDALSPVGDMLSPALSLLVPHFIRSTSFEKYIVAYFDDICSEEDVPSPFNITLRYKLMKQFEEVFFRILDTEKHEPGRVNHIKGLSEDDYYKCPSGRALQDAIKAFHAYQLENPRWFEDELLENSPAEVEEPSVETCGDAEITTNLLTLRSHDSKEVSSHEKTQESDVIRDKIIPNAAVCFQMSSLTELNPIMFRDLQPV